LQGRPQRPFGKIDRATLILYPAQNVRIGSSIDLRGRNAHEAAAGKNHGYKDQKSADFSKQLGAHATAFVYVLPQLFLLNAKGLSKASRPR
jgi:hypothetical protein